MCSLIDAAGKPSQICHQQQGTESEIQKNKIVSLGQIRYIDVTAHKHALRATTCLVMKVLSTLITMHIRAELNNKLYCCVIRN